MKEGELKERRRDGGEVCDAERTSSISVLKDSELVVTIHMSAVRSGSSGTNTAACLRTASRMRQIVLQLSISKFLIITLV